MHNHHLINEALRLEKAKDYSGACRLYIGILSDKNQFQLHPQANFGLNNIKKHIHGQPLMEIEKSIEDHPKGYLFPMMITDAIDGIRGVVALEDVKEDELLLSIPLDCMITAAQGKRTDFGKQFIQKKVEIKQSEKIIFILFAILDVVKENPNHLMADEQVYVETGTCLFWDDQTLNLLKGSHMYKEIKTFQQEIKDDYQTLCDALVGFKEACSLHRFTKLKAEIVSKNFGFESQDTKHNAIVPIGDCLNHSNKPNAVWSFNKKTLCYEEHALKDIAAGELVVHTYHDDPANADLLIDYGFALEPSENDYLILDNGICLFKTPTKEFPRSIWKEYIEVFKKQYSCPDVQAEMLVLSQIFKQIKPKIDSYATSLNDDTQWVQKNKNFSNEYFIRKALIAEKKLLLEWYNVCRDIMYSSQLTMKDRKTMVKVWKSEIKGGPRLYSRDIWSKYILDPNNNMDFAAISNPAEKTG